MTGNWDSDEASGLRAEALDVLSDALQWQLAETRWRAIDQILAAMDVAVADRDLDALMAASADLELAGPLRITRIGADPVLSAPAEVRDRLNRLVFTLGDVPAASEDHPARGETSAAP